MQAFLKIDAVLYINLDHRKDRKEDLLRELKRLQVPEEKIYRVPAIHDFLNGHRGCALSHIKALKMAKEKKFHPVLIIEDDCMFDATADKINGHLEFFFQTVPPNEWDVFLLGGKVKKKRPTEYPKVYRILKSYLSHAYIVHRNYIDELIRCFEESLILMDNLIFHFEALWTALDQHWYFWQIKDKWYAVDLFAHQKESFSDIDGICREKKHFLH
ncbi:MAG: hypothetical protein Tsb0015_07320 [Simkaniaceae bacterium]